MQLSKAGADPKTVANWMLGDLSKMINENGLTFAESKVSPENLAGMIALIDKGTISGKIAKKSYCIHVGIRQGCRYYRKRRRSCSNYRYRRY